MPHGSLQIGTVEVVPLCDGWAPLPLVEECPGHDVDWEAERARFPWAFADDQRWAWHVHAFLLRTPDGAVLVDTGIGHLGLPPFDVEGRIDDELRAARADVDEIRHVVHTHLHADHAGGACRPDGSPRFPNAVHHVHPADWAFFEGADDAGDFNGRAAMTRLADEGRLDLDPEDREVAPGVRVVHAPGHTPGHRSVALTSGGETMLLTGDLLHVTPQVAHPDWRSNHDEDPAEACRSRAELLGRTRSEAWQLGVSHFGEPFGSVDEAGWLPRSQVGPRSEEGP